MFVLPALQEPNSADALITLWARLAKVLVAARIFKLNYGLLKEVKLVAVQEVKLACTGFNIKKLLSPSCSLRQLPRKLFNKKYGFLPQAYLILATFRLSSKKLNMLKSYFTIALRHLTGHKLFSALNIFCLAIGVT